MELKEIASHFALTNEISEIESLGTGLINDTYRIKTVAPDAPDYVLQRINQNIFKDVALMQNNIQRITNHIRHKLQERNENDLERKTLTIIPTKNGKSYYYDGENYWRVTIFIKDSKTYEQITPEFAHLTGIAFGEFQYFLSDLSGEPLGATIPDFHNMPFRIQQLKEAIQNNAVNRLAKVQSIVNELLSREEEMCLAERLYKEGKLPKRIAHCDTKVNNMLFDKDGNFLCVIDLDTTMPGFVLSDFGDFIRTAGNTGEEDDKNLNNISVNMDIFKEFARGYIQSAKAFLTPIEISLLPFSGQMMTYMQTIRFLADYINGDTYYKIKYPEHNYQRTLAQLTLLHSIDAHLEEMNQWIDSLLK